MKPRCFSSGFRLETVNRFFRGLVLALSMGMTVLLLVSPASGATGDPSQVAVVVGSNAPELEHYAANQLCAYLGKLFGISSEPSNAAARSAGVIFLIGSPLTNEAVKQATATKPFPKVTDQGVVLRRTEFQGRPTLIVGGGSPKATLWAVYELVRRWGVRYMLHGDVFPAKVAPFRLPDINLVMEPKLTIREWRVVNEHAMGPLSWGMAQYRLVIDQLAKLKFNRIFVNIWPQDPFLDYEYRGVKRHSASLFWGFHYPITDDMVGRQLFGTAKEFWNPDLPITSNYKELTAAGERLVHHIMAYAHERGMQVVINANISDFPPEFAAVLKDSRKVHELSSLTIVPGPKTTVDDPALNGLAATILRATVNTYPETDYVLLWMPEFRQWVAPYKRAWKALDARYGIGKVRTLDQVLAEARHRKGYSGSTERAEDEVKGDVVNLYFFDRLLRQEKVLQGTRRPNMKFIYGQVSEELFPILGRILPPGWETHNGIDYTPSRIVAREQVMATMPARQVPSIVNFTLHDDNIGPVPQLETSPLAKLTVALIRYGWAGFATRYWLIGDHDPCVSYIARAAWKPNITPDAVDRDLMTTVCGRGCADNMLTVFHEVEAATLVFEWHDESLAFPVPDMMMKYWKPGPMHGHLDEARRDYQTALAAAQAARAKARPEGRKYVDYWIGRLRFGIGYLDTIEAVNRAATAEAAKNITEERKQARLALADAWQALEAYASVAQDQSDKGAIATMNEYVYRPLKAKVTSLNR